ncbi:MAG: 3-deoxy-D-manno-octulosonic acid transferase [Candidatus Aminicenantes bacterium]|nr:3-deoxy-D-manno-octulosonic acid transferase [Candidatus Aminicenantes bacterium]MDH5705982.1 3-deoxy-D-manno-octulosonic acid transferase [Candidatus Aminicenantes bacterium]
MGHNLNKGISEKKSIWFHAVSVGEVLSLQNLIKKIKEKHPDWQIHFSTLTNTGMRVAREKLTDADHLFFVPMDFAFLVRKFFRALKPSVFVLAESEFWPNLIREAKKSTDGVLLINGRISPRSFKKYFRFRALTKKVLRDIDLFLVQTSEDKAKLERIGVSSELVRVAGNLKAEIDLPSFTPEEILGIKEKMSIPASKKVVVAGSTRNGEERKLLESFVKARRAREDLVLIMAPRHPERFDEVEKLCQEFSLQAARKTQVTPNSQWEVLILDTIGELARFYALCDLAFIGGSLVPWGGHNLLEPAFYSKPVFFGPHMKNFAYLAEIFAGAGAARVAHDGKDLVEMFLMRDERTLSEMGRKAKDTLISLQGATEKTIQAIEDMMTVS